MANPLNLETYTAITNRSPNSSDKLGDLHPDGDRLAVALPSGQAGGNLDKVTFIFNFSDERPDRAGCEKMNHRSVSDRLSVILNWTANTPEEVIRIEQLVDTNNKVLPDRQKNIPSV